MTDLKPNNAAEYRELVDGILRGVDRLLELQHEIWDLPQSIVRNDPHYRGYFLALSLDSSSDSRDSAQPPRPSKELQKWIDENERSLRKPKIEYKTVCLEVLDFQRRAHFLRSEVGDDFRIHLLSSHVDAFYEFAEILEADIVNEELIKNRVDQRALEIARPKLEVLQSQWKALQPNFTQLEDRARSKLKPSDAGAEDAANKAKLERIDAARSKSEELDDIENLLNGQALCLFRFLRNRNHWTDFKTLLDESTCFRKNTLTDAAIKKAIERAKEAIADTPYIIEIGSHRARLVDIRS